MAGKFSGMVYPDASPIMAPDTAVKRVHMFDVPTGLRDHAATVITHMSGDHWWTIGEFRYEGEDYTTAYGQWSRAGVTFGIDNDDA